MLRYQKRPANLVKTDELVYNRRKENDSETQQKAEERRRYFAEVGKHMDDLTGWSGKRYGVAENVVTFAREISQNTGRQILFDPYIGEGELSLDEVANGSYSNGVIRINPNSENPVAQIIVHELTHSYVKHTIKNLPKIINLKPPMQMFGISAFAETLPYA